MDVIQTVAWIFIVLTVIKLIAYLVAPKEMWRFAKKMTGTFRYLWLVLAAVLLYFLLQTYTILDILVISLFAGLLIGFGMMTYVPQLMKTIKPEQILKDNWLYVLIWLMLLIWGTITLIL